MADAPHSAPAARGCARPTAPAAGVGEAEAAIVELEDVFARMTQQYRLRVARQAAALQAGMSPGTFKAFVAICHGGPLTPSALAEQMMLDRAQVSRMLKDLEAAGLVRREPDPQDRRSALVSATETGLTRLQEVREGVHVRALRDALARWELADIRTLTLLLGRFADAREDEEPGDGSEGAAAADDTPRG